MIFAQNPTQLDFNHTLRIDYIHAGNVSQQWMAVEGVYRQNGWGGPQKNLIDKVDLGNHILEMRLLKTNELLYRYNFNSVFEEYKTTKEAKELTKAFKATALMPFPKKKVIIEIFTRDKHHKAVSNLKFNLDPKSTMVRHEPLPKNVDVIRFSGGEPGPNQVDIALIAEGYTAKRKREIY